MFRSRRVAANVTATFVLAFVAGCEAAAPVPRASLLSCGLPTSIATPRGLTSQSRSLGTEADEGISAMGKGAVLFDLRTGKVSVFPVAVDTSKSVFGSTGGGPGEFTTYATAERLRQYPVQWVDATDDAISTFDGQRISRFDARGKLSQMVTVPREVVAGFVRVGRIRVWRDFVLVGAYDSGMMRDESRALRIYKISKDSTSIVARFPLASLPKSVSGQPFDGLAEAKPSWDLWGDCIVAVDGHSDSLFVTNIVTHRTSTALTNLPDRFRSGIDESYDRLLGKERSAAEAPLPARPARVSALVADPSGWIWLRPAVASANLVSRIEIWRVHLESGFLRIDTLAAFPMTFDREGCSLGIGTDAADEPRLVRSCESR